MLIWGNIVIPALLGPVHLHHDVLAWTKYVRMRSCVVVNHKRQCTLLHDESLALVLVRIPVLSRLENRVLEISCFSRAF